MVLFGARAAAGVRWVLMRVVPLHACCSSGAAAAEAEALLAQLAGCAVAYCWQELGADQWGGLLRRAREGVASAAVTLEDQARLWRPVGLW